MYYPFLSAMIRLLQAVETYLVGGPCTHLLTIYANAQLRPEFSYFCEKVTALLSQLSLNVMTKHTT
jgi:hypothetical protein